MVAGVVSDRLALVHLHAACTHRDFGEEETDTVEAEAGGTAVAAVRSLHGEAVAARGAGQGCVRAARTSHSLAVWSEDAVIRYAESAE